jgi:hypothetical protein
MSKSQAMHSFGILNVSAFQRCAFLGCELNHLKIIGVFETNTEKFLA